MDLLLEDIKDTLGASNVALPTTTPISAKEDRQQAVVDAVRSLHLQEAESGGVALPAMRTSSTLEPLEAAG